MRVSVYRQNFVAPIGHKNHNDGAQRFECMWIRLDTTPQRTETVSQDRAVHADAR